MTSVSRSKMWLVERIAVWEQVQSLASICSYTIPNANTINVNTPNLCVPITKWILAQGKLPHERVRACEAMLRNMLMDG